MIESRELIAVANTFGLRPNMVEKDYILGRLLAGIYNDPIILNEWVFKGGTCLKKYWCTKGVFCTTISTWKED